MPKLRLRLRLLRLLLLRLWLRRLVPSGLRLILQLWLQPHGLRLALLELPNRLTPPLPLRDRAVWLRPRMRLCTWLRERLRLLCLNLAARMPALWGNLAANADICGRGCGMPRRTVGSVRRVPGAPRANWIATHFPCTMRPFRERIALRASSLCLNSTKAMRESGTPRR